MEPRLHLFQLARHGQRAGTAGGVPAGDGGAVFEHVEHIGADAIAQALKRVKRQGFEREVLPFGQRHGGTRDVVGFAEGNALCDQVVRKLGRVEETGGEGAGHADFIEA